MIRNFSYLSALQYVTGLSSAQLTNATSLTPGEYAQ